MQSNHAVPDAYLIKPYTRIDAVVLGTFAVTLILCQSSVPVSPILLISFTVLPDESRHLTLRIAPTEPPL